MSLENNIIIDEQEALKLVKVGDFDAAKAVYLSNDNYQGAGLCEKIKTYASICEDRRVEPSEIDCLKSFLDALPNSREGLRNLVYNKLQELSPKADSVSVPGAKGLISLGLGMVLGGYLLSASTGDLSSAIAVSAAVSLMFPYVYISNLVRQKGLKREEKIEELKTKDSAKYNYIKNLKHFELNLLRMQ